MCLGNIIVKGEDDWFEAKRTRLSITSTHFIEEIHRRGRLCH
jgi:hypothetical protein